MRVCGVWCWHAAEWVFIIHSLWSLSRRVYPPLPSLTPSSAARAARFPALLGNPWFTALPFYGLLFALLFLLFLVFALVPIGALSIPWVEVGAGTNREVRRARPDRACTRAR